MGPFSFNGEEGRRVTHRVPQKDQREATAGYRRGDMGDVRGIISGGRGGNAVENDLYREIEVRRVIVGGVTTNI